MQGLSVKNGGHAPVERRPLVREKDASEGFLIAVSAKSPALVQFLGISSVYLFEDLLTTTYYLTLFFWGDVAVGDVDLNWCKEWIQRVIEAEKD